MFRTVLLSFLVTAAATACGGKSTPVPATTATEPAGNPDMHHEHDFPAEMDAFHDKLAPLWHDDDAQARVVATCAATGELDALAAGVKGTPPADVDAAAWDERATVLVDSITRLSAACGSADRATFDADFHAVHSAFHGLIELLPASAGHKAAH